MKAKLQLKSKADKVKFLAGLHAGNRSVSELMQPVVTFLTFRTSKPGVVYNQSTNSDITPEAAQTLKDSASNKDMVWLEGLNDGDLDVWWKKDAYQHLDIFYSRHN